MTKTKQVGQLLQGSDQQGLDLSLRLAPVACGIAMQLHLHVPRAANDQSVVFDSASNHLVPELTGPIHTH
ncbi:hypothetical protein THARTR1_07747 [Trichoderma harzianum]|uniref:Uncharacterized protein n=1 Tax=Trichoderma harzianum TaxID=5544 RepID=A0A2K0U1I0_TRIHA|nr:hypothetical protein THARTR1_07747 [Trichoderma harzianum]